MEDSLSLLQVLPAVLLVLLGLLLVMMSRQRRRGGAAPTRSVAVSTKNSWVAKVKNDDIADDDEPVAEHQPPVEQAAPVTDLGVTLPTEPPVATDDDDEDDEDDEDLVSEELPPSGVRGLGRRSQGRHSAAPAPVKRRRRPLDVGPHLGPLPEPTPVVEEVAVLPDPVDPEPPAPADVPEPPAPTDVPENVPAPDREHVFGADAEAGTDTDADTDAEAAEVAEASEDIHTYRLRVDATIQAMSRRIEPTETPDLIEARMLAALDRLDGPAGFTRPMLSPAGASRSGGELEAPPQSVPPALAVELPVEELPVSPPVDAESVYAPPSADDTAPPQVPQVPQPPEPPQPESPATDEPEVVLPVPPTASKNDAPRRGLRRRGKSS